MIFITGDMHGLMERFQDSAFRHIKKGDTLIICGDFGFLWDCLLYTSPVKQQQRNVFCTIRA